ncbi:MAG: hypothetical protein JNL28_05950 [Planctomycetes bacterium]|nr:hypothetical protein [Planctomycetota bacterium]
MGVDPWIDWQGASFDAFAWLLTYALHSTVLIGGAWLAAVLLARAACRSARLRELLPTLRASMWKVALVGGIVTASAQTWLQDGSWRLNYAPPGHEASASIAAGEPRELGIHPLAVGERVPLPTVERKQAALGTAGLVSGVQPASEDTAATWIRVALGLWAAGVAFGLARWACQWNRLLRSLDDRVPIRSGVLHDLFTALRTSTGSRAPVRLCRAPGIGAPITLGVRRAEICVPPRAEAELQPDEITALLAHELAHVERRDPAWLVVSRAIEVVFFFQPLNRLCARWLSDEAEYLADDWAVAHTGERVGLASCLTEVAGWMVHTDESALVVAMAARGTRLSLRVGRLLDENHEPGVAARGTWWTTALAPCALSAAMFVPGFSAEPANAGLARRTSELEAALATWTPDSNVGHLQWTANLSLDSCSAVAEIEGVIDDLENEIEIMRETLTHKVGGDKYEDALAALERRVSELRERTCEVETQLEDLDEPEPEADDSRGRLSIRLKLAPKDLR